MLAKRIYPEVLIMSRLPISSMVGQTACGLPQSAGGIFASEV
jgi:hypothetical protein